MKKTITVILLVSLFFVMGMRSRYGPSIWQTVAGGVQYIGGNVNITNGTLTVSGALTVGSSDGETITDNTIDDDSIDFGTGTNQVGAADLTDFAAETKKNSVALLGTATLNVQSTGQTTIYTVPTGKRCILDHIKIVAGATASPTAVVSFGQNGAATDFLGNHTMTNLAAQYDTVICTPIPNATPVKTKSYAADTVIEADVTTADTDGGTDNTVYVYGTLY